MSRLHEVMVGDDVCELEGLLILKTFGYTLCSHARAEEHGVIFYYVAAEELAVAQQVFGAARVKYQWRPPAEFDARPVSLSTSEWITLKIMLDSAVEELEADHEVAVDDGEENQHALHEMLVDFRAVRDRVEDLEAM